MHITKFTDYSLRTLMFLALQPKGKLMNIEQISESIDVSRAHLMKIIHRLSVLSLVETVRGRSGGVRLDLDHGDVNVGGVVRQLEEITEIVPCNDGPCLFRGACALDQAFRKAADAFLQELDQYTLADLVKRRTHLQKIVMQRSAHS